MQETSNMFRATEDSIFKKSFRDECINEINDSYADYKDRRTLLSIVNKKMVNAVYMQK